MNDVAGQKDLSVISVNRGGQPESCEIVCLSCCGHFLCWPKQFRVWSIVNH